MIDNLLDTNLVTSIQKRGYKTRDITTSPNPLISDNGRSKYSTGIYVTPIRRSGGGKNLSHTTQLRCRKCSFKTTNQCSKCKPTYAICLGRYGIDLFVKHYEEKHE